MALMPEDVLKKNFIATQFRRGYDEHEVDDFLDEVVVELRRLSGENEDLRAQLKVCQESKGTGTRGTGVAVSAAAEGQREAATASPAAVQGDAQDRVATSTLAAEAAEEQSAARIAKAKAAAEQAEAQAAERTKAARDAMEAKEATDKSTRSSASVSAPIGDEVLVAEVANAAAAASASAAGVLALAQKLHDQYVSEGQNTRERLITEGQTLHDQLIGEVEAKKEELLSTAQGRHDALIAEAATRHEQMITEARERSTGLVAEAQQEKATVLQTLGSERDVLQKKIDQLRTFERDYRGRLKSYLEGQLQELGQTGADHGATEEGDGQNPVVAANKGARRG